MKKVYLGALLAAALSQVPIAAAQAPAPAKPAPAAAPAKPAAAATGPVATVNGVQIPRQRADLITQQRAQQGDADGEQLRAAVKEELINREIIQQEATRTGFAKRAELQQELDFVRQTVIVQAYLRDWAQKNPTSDADIQKEYARAKAQTGSTEYRARHILVATEDEAKKLIAEIAKGAKFEEVAQKNTKDDGTRPRGGDLDWNVPGTFDKAFSDAMVKLEKGTMTSVPVRTRFGFHIIRLEDVRPVNFPPLAQVKPQIQQRMTQQRIDALVRDLRGKAKVE
ncbi:MAG: peptidylprolyl isomerase [Proteobacteria bacterium]|nr:peptidylprolyl isomerase [Pseudomonadota bacterium]MDA0982023.1 peptidylprolyl isomerase [Pseudomonadota bacterium]